MTPRLGWAFHAFHLAVLRAASNLVPTRRRREWMREWQSELWHVRRERAPAPATSWRAEREITAFCLGAFRDALYLRQEHERPETTHGSAWGSPAHCIFGLSGVICAAFAFALLAPGVRAVNNAPRFTIASGLILIHRERSDGDLTDTVTMQDFRRWSAHSQRSFDDFAFYSIVRERVWPGSPAETEWSVAHASANLFPLLGVPLRFASPPDPRAAPAPLAILSCEAFEREFGGHPLSAASTLRIGQVDARIAGVAPCGAWALPGNVDAWLLEPGSALADGAAGYVVAHLSPRGQAEMDGPRVAIADGGRDSDDSFIGDRIQCQARGPWDIYLFTVLLALLALPAVTSVTMGETSFSSHKPSFSRQLYRWAFLAAKMALLLPIAWCVPVDLAYSAAASSSVGAQYAQLVSTFSICLLGMRWILLDQRQRCPVCLRRVCNPARVGDASRTFLGWNGTEMICLGGHTLLHVPGLPTSWFATQRWLYLDRSWEFLFAGSSEG